MGWGGGSDKDMDIHLLLGNRGQGGGVQRRTWISVSRITIFWLHKNPFTVGPMKFALAKSELPSYHSLPYLQETFKLFTSLIPTY